MQQKKYAIPYNKKLKERARRLRNQSTFPEILIWQKIKGKSLGYKFLRQKPLLNYIVDFYCHELLLVIEIDGKSHDSPRAQIYDRKREVALQKYGIEFIRFDNEAVLHNIFGVIWALEAKIVELEQKKGIQ